jgi:nicotinamidase-related amidase
MWRQYYRKWQNVTRDRLDPEVLDLVSELRKFAPPAAVIDRMVYSAFAGSRLVEFLSEHHVDTLIISGGETDVCVLSTVLSAIDLGYRIVLVDGALCSSSDESHDAILNLYRQRFDIHVGVANVEQLLGLWARE